MTVYTENKRIDTMKPLTIAALAPLKDRLRAAERDLDAAVFAEVSDEEYAVIRARRDALWAAWKGEGPDPDATGAGIHEAFDTTKPSRADTLASLSALYAIALDPATSETESRAAMKRYAELRPAVAGLCVIDEKANRKAVAA